ncbi:MAG: hypothetical protein KC635_08460 [Myxococcales bacterium]|nr:hypothetical protein [Myxococcales bacterium]MCB9733593.1 thiopurine S-methyltransferase [Deltaproteobacteria bacterium]
MEFKFWKERWDTGHIGFHDTAPNRHLLRFADHLESPNASGVLVPLCGKTVDLTWLSERFEHVVGVEFVETAVRDYFAERGITPEALSVSGVPALRSDGVTLLCSDFHAVTLAHTGPIQRVFDRASMIALPPETRPRYAAHLLSLMPPGGRILLVTTTYDQGLASGPPFSVPDDEVRAYYGATCDVRVLARETSTERPAAVAAGGGQAMATVWLITKH